jgi:NAD-dependent SIR2 family protein deacetylase
MKAIILLPPPEGWDGETQLSCMKCGELKEISEFRDSNECMECDAPDVVGFGMQSQTRLGGSSERPNNKEASYTKHGNHQENFSATKYIKP